LGETDTAHFNRYRRILFFNIDTGKLLPHIRHVT